MHMRELDEAGMASVDHAQKMDAVGQVAGGFHTRPIQQSREVGVTS
jgi:hypothetical protein